MHTTHAATLRRTSAALALVLTCSLSASTGCKDREKERQEQEEQEKENKKKNKEAVKRAKEVLKTAASLRDKVTGSAPKDVKASLESRGDGSFANFDVVFVDDLAKEDFKPTFRMFEHARLEECARDVKAGHGGVAGYTECDSVKYLVVLRPSKFEEPRVGDSTFTPGVLEAAAFVFDLKDGSLVGGGYVSGKTPDSISAKASSAEYELGKKLVESARESLFSALQIKKTG